MSRITGLGATRWAIAEGYIPDHSTSAACDMVSHETLCILNTSEVPARVTLTVYFTDQEPAGPFRVEVPPERTRHLRLNDLDDPVVLPRGVDFSVVLESDVPVVVQHTRLDSRQPPHALLSTIAYPG